MEFTIKFDEPSESFIARYFVKGKKKKKTFKVTEKQNTDVARSLALDWLNKIIDENDLWYEVTRDEYDDFALRV